MKLNSAARSLLAALWHCHEHNPINHFEYLSLEGGREVITHPASRRAAVEPEPGALEELVRLGLVRGRSNLSLTYRGIRYCQARRR